MKNSNMYTIKTSLKTWIIHVDNIIKKKNCPLKEHIIPGTPVTIKKEKEDIFQIRQKRAVGIEPGTFAMRVTR